ncbi:DUF6172 family protein [Poseidonibacter sp. 1_MG-2023]|uniref:DUF6172 family protein n=1 Tax=Poseidonibacter TaxID=2321187 RepID=UPI001E396853|nr:MULTISPECIES: DUF6172 family protein [Poseidonibacter]MDO6828493.1 DUF6172 family protein [Poseidonibacter sp. 1_MG-2023]
MKKTFKLNVENKHPDRQVESIKHEIRKYIKREKKKPLPEGADFWKFECKFAKNSEEPKTIEFIDITKNIDEASNEKCETLYMEILSIEGKREAKPELQDAETTEEDK